MSSALGRADAKAGAVVVGLCAHGLATARALSRHGVEVVALEADTTLPGCATRMASVVNAGPMKGEGLHQTLIAAARSHGWTHRPVLFLMNDRMVRDVASHWSLLEPYYRISWSRCADRILQLMSKDNLPSICERNAVMVPRTARYESERDAQVVADRISFPAIVKPALPMGSFKAVLIDSVTELQQLAARHAGSLPFVVQEWIAGGPSSLKFCSLYLDEGRVLARFEGRKAYAGPDGMGQATVMEPAPDDAVHEAAMRVVEGLQFTGPLAVEFKQDPQGKLWLIEPNVGRTEYCLDVCVENGINFPFLEYCNVLGLPPPAARPRNARIWFDTDRDPLAWLRFLFTRGPDRRALHPIFPYLRLSDLRPWFAALLKRLRLRR